MIIPLVDMAKFLLLVEHISVGIIVVGVDLAPRAIGQPHDGTKSIEEGVVGLAIAIGLTANA